MPGPTFPAEIWIHAAPFVPEDALRGMISVNSTFFQLAMDARYRSITLSTFDDKTVKWMPRYREPAVAHRVRSLRVCLNSQPDRFEAERWGWTWTHKIPVGEVMQAITATVARFARVTSVRIEWTHAPARAHLLPFLDAAWPTFGSSVQTAAFCVSLPAVHTLVSTAGRLPQLRDLRVEYTGGSSSGAASQACPLADFMNGAAPVLRALSLHSHSFSDDLEPLLLRQLRPMPHLVRLALSLGSLPRYDTFPPALQRFLCAHADTLRHLHWAGDRTPTFHLEEPHARLPVADQAQRAARWLRETGLAAVFAGLDTPTLPVPLKSSFVLPCIQLAADTLTALRLVGRPGLQGFLRDYELDALAGALAAPQRGRLRALDVDVLRLSARNVALLAQRLPRLDHLGLRFEYMRTESGVYTYPKNTTAELALAREMAETFRKRGFGAWALRDVSLTKKAEQYDPDLNIKLMVLMAECVPAVRTLDGVPRRWRI